MMELFDLCLYKAEHGAKLYHCIVHSKTYPGEMVVIFEAHTMQKLETILHYFGVDTRLQEGWFQKQFWIYDVPIFPERNL